MSFKVGDWVEVKEQHSRWFQVGDRFKITEVSSKQVHGVSPSHGLSCPFEISKDKVFAIYSGSALPGASDKIDLTKIDMGDRDSNHKEFPTTVTVDKHSLTGGPTTAQQAQDKDFDKALKDLEQWSGVKPKQKPCYCGSDTIEYPFHSDWCPKYEELSGSS